MPWIVVWLQSANGASMLAVGGRYNLDKQSVVSCKLQLPLWRSKLGASVGRLGYG